MRIDDSYSTAPRCSTSSPTWLLFVVSDAVRFATSEPQNSGTPGMSRPPRFWTLTLATLASHHPRISWFVSCQAERQIQLLLRCQVAVVHIDHQILNENRRAGSKCLFPTHNKRTCKVYRYISMKILELWNSWGLCFAFFIIVISCRLNSIASPLSFAAVPRPRRTSPC